MRPWALPHHALPPGLIAIIGAALLVLLIIAVLAHREESKWHIESPAAFLREVEKRPPFTQTAVTAEPLHQLAPSTRRR